MSGAERREGDRRRAKDEMICERASVVERERQERRRRRGLPAA